MNPTHPTRRLLHTREVFCEAFERSDGLYDIEGCMHDITPTGTDLILKTIPANARLHDMRIVMTVNSDLVIQSISAGIQASPTAYCPEASAAYSALAGLRIGPGFREQVIARVGGIRGCTHLTELLGPMATTAMQARFAIERASAQWRGRLEGDAPLPRPDFIDSCHTHRADGDAAKVYWPESRRATAPKVA